MAQNTMTHVKGNVFYCSVYIIAHKKAKIARREKILTCLLVYASRKALKVLIKVTEKRRNNKHFYMQKNNIVCLELVQMGQTDYYCLFYRKQLKNISKHQDQECGHLENKTHTHPVMVSLLSFLHRGAILLEQYFDKHRVHFCKYMSFISRLVDDLSHL